MTTYIGVSGWNYDSWEGGFYPDDLPKKDQLAYASRQFESIEINGSFYSLLKPESYQRWHGETPAKFVFAVKGSRFITHNKKLKDIEIPLANFFASGLLALGNKLGPILWQLADKTTFDAKKIERFFQLLPHDSEGGARLARKHDERLEGRSWTTTDANHRIRHAMEVRHESFLTDDMVRLARRHGIALVFADSGSSWPYFEELTAGFVYIRLHGSPKTYSSRYSDDALDRFASRIRSWRSGKEPRDAERITNRKPPPRKSRDVYVYFDNDQQGHAPRDALRLADRLK